MRVEISVLEPGYDAETYVVDSEGECHDEVDLFAYRHAIDTREEVRVGCVLAQLMTEA
jgi:hypothetical protein